MTDLSQEFQPVDVRQSDIEHDGVVKVAARDSAAGERAVDVQVNRLRRKIETDPANPLFLQAVPGLGLILREQLEAIDQAGTEAPDDQPLPGPTAADPAYLIFTSGSTRFNFVTEMASPNS